MTLPVLSALALVLVTLGAAPQEPPAVQQPAPAADGWRELLARDERAAFAPLTGRAALDALDEPELEMDERAVALFALGSSADVGERGRLETWARRGAPRERRAAVLALGELGPGSTALLVELAEGEPGELAECALLALLRSGQADAVAYVERLAAGADALSGTARSLITFQRDRSNSQPSDAARALLELRYEAARRFGLIDGKTWRVLLYERLLEDEAFLDDLVFGSVARLRVRGVKDHVYGALMQDGREPALRAAVRAIPNELAQMAQASLWSPRGEQWVAVLEEIEAEGLESLCEPLLLQALATSGLEGWAAFLLMRGGNTRGRPVLERVLPEATPQTRRRVAEALGASGERSSLGWLAKFARDDSEEVRAAALVAQARLGDLAAQTTLEILLFTQDVARREVSRDMLIEALARAGDDPLALELLETALPLLVGRPRVTAAVALAGAGREQGIRVVREQLQARMPRGAEGARLVRALAHFPTAADIELMREAFPREDDRELNAALAEVLLEAKVPAVVALLRGALWRPPLHRSMLAAALVVDAGGVGLLRRELASDPHHARAEDLRRVGYALGFWGGIREVEELARRRGVGHPALQGAVLGALAARTL
jgi:hypothetical protein